jgi:hypothetical protein
MHQMLMGGPGRSPASGEGTPGNTSITATPTRAGDAPSKGNYFKKSKFPFSKFCKILKQF